MVDLDAYREENRRIRRLQRLIDLIGSLILQPATSYTEAVALVDLAKHHALELFPDKGETFEIIYRPRLNRLLNEKLAGGDAFP